MDRLKNHLNSRYIEAANALRPNGAKKRIVAYVESYEDIFFWRSVLDEFETEGIYFEVMLPSRTTLEKGKKSVLMNQLGDQLGSCMIACVDADYDYLLQGLTETSRRILNNPYVFHTYVYAIENYLCYSGGLHEAMVMATLNDHEPFSLEHFVEEFSTIIWPLFVWNIWCYRFGFYHRFSLMDFCNVVCYRDIVVSHPERTLQWVRNQVNRRIAQLQRSFPQGKKTLKLLQNELLQLGLLPEETYLYMQGHKLMEGVVLPLLEPICTQLRRERENEIQHLALHSTQLQNEIASYRHSQIPVEVALRKNTNFRRSAVFQHLRNDLRDFVQKFG